MQLWPQRLAETIEQPKKTFYMQVKSMKIHDKNLSSDNKRQDSKSK